MKFLAVFALAIFTGAGYAKPYAKLKLMPTTSNEWLADTGWTLIGVYLDDPEWGPLATDTKLRLIARPTSGPDRTFELDPATALRRGYALAQIATLVHAPRNGLIVRIATEHVIGAERIEDFRLALNCEADLSPPSRY